MRTRTAWAVALLSIVAGTCLLTVRASAQLKQVTQIAKVIPILDASGKAVARISIRGGQLVIADPQGNELFRTSAQIGQASYPALSRPSLAGGKADGSDDVESLRTDVDTLASSIGALTERVNQLSSR